MNLAQSAFTCSKLTIEILEQGAKQICVGVGLHKTFFLDLKIKFDYKKTDWWISEGSYSFFCVKIILIYGVKHFLFFNKLLPKSFKTLPVKYMKQNSD